MSWHGQINRTLWEVQKQVEAHPDQPRFRRELVRAYFLQRFEYDKSQHIARDDRTFLFLHDQETPTCLLLHGASGTPAEMRELGTYLYQNGISVFCPRMSRVDAKERLVSWESWATQAETALDTLMEFSKNTFVVGLSLGGTLAMVLGRKKGVAGIALLSPALYPRPTIRNRLLGIVRLLVPPLFFRFAGWNGEVIKAMDTARRNAKRIRIPALAMQAQDDPFLSLRGIKFIRKHARLKGNEVRVLEQGGHVITCGPARDEVAHTVAEFVHRVAKTPEGERVRATGRPEAAPDEQEPRTGRGDGRSRRGGRGRGGRGRSGGGGNDDRGERRAQRPDRDRSDRDRPDRDRSDRDRSDRDRSDRDRSDRDRSDRDRNDRSESERGEQGGRSGAERRRRRGGRGRGGSRRGGGGQRSDRQGGERREGDRQGGERRENDRRDGERRSDD